MKRINILSIIIFLAISFLSISIANSEVINAKSCSQPDVQAAINSANNGDTVVIPAGECTWTTSVSIPDDKKITLQGQGYDNTVVTRAGTAIVISQSGARVTGIGFIIGDNNLLVVKGTGWRIDHCKFNNTSGTGVKTAVDANGRNIKQYPVGLIDNCIFINAKILVNGHYNFPDISSVWARDLNLGADDAVYVEDCIITRNDGTTRNFLDGNRGGMTVFRYNTVSDGYLEAHSLQSDNERAFRKWEIYGNTLHAATDQYIPIRFIGGTGVIFNNQFSGDYNFRGIDFYNRRCYDSIGGAGLCDGNSTWDGNQDANGWPCRDQIGRGPDEYLFDKDSLPYPSQASVPAYLWLNRDLGLNGDSSNIANVKVSNDSDQHIKPNRDYYNEVAIFDGTSGVGVGTLANRPSTCTPGVAYWATDQGSWNKIPGGEQGVLYKCISTNTWEKYYEPYEYPHPLTKETVLAAPELMLQDTFSGGSVWTKSAEKTYTYYLTSKKYGGKNIKKVSEDGTELVETASVDLCESTTGSYFVDPSDGTVHVHCTDGTDADTHEIGVCYN